MPEMSYITTYTHIGIRSGPFKNFQHWHTKGHRGEGHQGYEEKQLQGWFHGMVPGPDGTSNDDDVWYVYSVYGMSMYSIVCIYIHVYMCAWVVILGNMEWSKNPH